MTDQELLQAIRETVKEEVRPLKEDIATMKEELAEVRDGVNTLLEWADKVGESIEFPLPKIM